MKTAMQSSFNLSAHGLAVTEVHDNLTLSLLLGCSALL